MAKKQIDRIDNLKAHLWQRESWTIEELARELNVSRRTLFRDISHLRSCGIHVEADVGRGGGIRLSRRYNPREVSLSEDQSLYLLIATAVTEKLGFPFFNDGKSAIPSRLLTVFPEARVRTLSRLRRRIFIGAPASERIKASYSRPSKPIVKIIETAFLKSNCLEVEYEDEKSNRSIRTVEPHGIFVNFPVWYLLTYDHLRNAPRTFRIDRIRAAKEKGAKPFQERAQEIFQETIGDEFGREL